MLEIGEAYKDGWGKEHTVAGIVKIHPEWVWTIGGFWFRQSDGRKISYNPKNGTHAPAERPSNWDLKVVEV